MDELEVLTRFRSDVPAPSAQSRTAARSALAETILAERHRHEPLDGSTGRGVVARCVAVAAAVLVIAGALAIASSRHSSTGPGTIGRSDSPSLLALTGPTLRLATYNFRLPAGFKTVDSPCAPAPSANGDPITDGRAAASADGGCLEVAYAVGPGTAPPAGAQPVQVGNYPGFLATNSATSETLYVAIPAAHDEYLVVLTAVDLSARQLVAIAATAFPSTPSSPTP